MKGTLFISLVLGLLVPSGLNAETRVALKGHIPRQIQNAIKLERVPSDEPVALSLVVKLDQNLLDQAIQEIYGKNASTRRRYLSSQEFTTRFGMAEKRQKLKEFAEANGLTVDPAEDKPDSMAVKVSGRADHVEKAFNVRLNHYRGPDGKIFRAHETDPVIPASLSSHIAAILGLSNMTGMAKPSLSSFPVSIPAGKVTKPSGIASRPALLSGATGPGGTLAPADIKTIYALNQTALNGSGQSVALFELDGFNPADIAAYESAFNLPSTPVIFVGVDETPNLCGGQSCLRQSPTIDQGMLEVALDVEMVTALAPGVSQILVYDGSNTVQGIYDVYNQIAMDNTAQVVSTSWFGTEQGYGSSFLQSESQIFQRMALQGQSIYAASGDSGAYGVGSTGNALDPASQPYVTGVGGTSLSGSIQSPVETTFNELASNFGAGGGGVSGYWPLPSYQTGLPGTASQQYRNIPDVSLNSDPFSGYGVYAGGFWSDVAGTSAAAPFWAGFTSLINQHLLASGSQSFGFANLRFYALGTSSAYRNVFNDITTGNNGYYNAGLGYDNATGWGSFKGSALINAVPSTVVIDTTPPTVQILTPVSGSTVAGLVTVFGTASDNIGVASIVIEVDGQNLGLATGTTSWTFAWDSTHLPNGPHDLTALALDFSDNQSTTSIQVTLSNSGIAPGLIVESTAAIAGQTATLNIDFSTGSISDKQVSGDLILPSSVTLLSYALGTAASSSGKLLSVTSMGGNDYHFSIYGFTQSAIPSGTVLLVQVQIASQTASGVLPVLLSNPTFTDIFNDIITSSGTVSSIMVTSPAPAITSMLSAQGNVGWELGYWITATKNPTSFNATGLPAGLHLFPNGLIDGLPISSGTTVAMISATNSYGTGSAPLTITVDSVSVAPTRLSISTMSVMAGQTATFSVNYSTGYFVVQSVFGTMTLPASTTLTGYQIGPAATAASKTLAMSSLGGNQYHFSINDVSNQNLNSGALITFQVQIATGTAPGALPISLSNTALTDYFGDAVPSTLTDGSIVVLPPPSPVIISSLSVQSQVGWELGYQIAATNSPTSFGATGLPAGLHLFANGLIDGFPVSSGTTVATISATNSNGPGTAPLNIIVSSGNSPSLIVSSTAATAGQTATLAVDFSTGSIYIKQISGILALPDSTSLIGSQIGSAATAASKLLSFEALGGNQYNFSIYGYSEGAILSGSLFSFQVQITSGVASGLWPVVLSSPTFTDIYFNDSVSGSGTGGSIQVTSLASVASLPDPPTLTIPSVMPSNGQFQVSYSAGYSVVAFQITITPMGSIAQTQGASTTSRPWTVHVMPNLLIVTQGTVDLTSLRLAPGIYDIEVRAMDASGNLSPPAAAVVTLTGSPSMVSIRVRPNPWRSDRETQTQVTFDQLPSGSTVKLFTLSGRWIRTLDGSSGQASWDLKNDSGERVASGMYFYLVTDNQGNISRGKLTIIH